MESTIPGYGYVPGVEPLVTRRQPFDTRWVTMAILIGSLLLVGLVVAWRIGYSLGGYSYSARVARVYVPLASLAILFIGWHPRGFPLAAGLFYGYLPLAQPTNASYLLAGNNECFATFEMVFALPLILVGLLGSSGARPGYGRPVPSLVSLSWVIVFVAGITATVLARSPEHAVSALFTRIVVPGIVTLVTFRRLRCIEDYQILWFGFVVGLLIISVYHLRRGVLGHLEWYETGGKQRTLTGGGSYGIPTLYIAGPALWFGHALAVRRSPLHGLPWLILPAVFLYQMWVGAHRGPTIFLCLLILLWIPGHILPYLAHGRGLLFIGLGGTAVTALITYFVRKTTLDLSFIVGRLTRLVERGLQEEPRYAIWEKAASYWAQSPIWGQGPNNWVVVDSQFASIHSSFFGVLFDLGLLGLIGYTMLFVCALWMTRRSQLKGLSETNIQFVRGCRMGWLLTILLLTGNLPFTSGLPRNTVFPYVILLFPMLAMLIHTRHPPPVYPAAVQAVSGPAPETLPNQAYAVPAPAQRPPDVP